MHIAGMSFAESLCSGSLWVWVNVWAMTHSENFYVEFLSLEIRMYVRYELPWGEEHGDSCKIKPRYLAVDHEQIDKIW